MNDKEGSFYPPGTDLNTAKNRKLMARMQKNKPREIEPGGDPGGFGYTRPVENNVPLLAKIRKKISGLRNIRRHKKEDLE